MRGRKPGKPKRQPFLLFRYRRRLDSEYLVATYSTLEEATEACDQLNKEILATATSPWRCDLAYVMRGSVKGPQLARAMEPSNLLAGRCMADVEAVTDDESDSEERS